MGWMYSDAWATKQDLVQELTRDAKCLDHSLVGNILWAVWGDTAGKYIICNLIAHDRSTGTYGYKDMDESMHPYYYSCPLKFLAMVPVACEAWRENVRKYHAEKKAKSAKRGSVQVGQTWKVKEGIKTSWGAPIEEVKVASVKPFRVDTKHGRFKFRATWLTDLVA